MCSYLFNPSAWFINSSLWLGYFFISSSGYKPENMISLVLFAVALGICGIIFNIYFYYFIKLFPKNNIYHQMAKIGCVAGMLGGICFFAVGLTPTNTIVGPHICLLYTSDAADE